MPFCCRWLLMSSCTLPSIAAGSIYGAPGVLLVTELEGGCGGTCVTARVMTVVGSAVGSVAGMVVTIVGAGVCFNVGNCVGDTVVGGVFGVEVVVFAATAVTEVIVVETAVTPGSCVPDGDCPRELSPAVAVAAIGVPVTCARCGSRRTAAAQRMRTTAMTHTHTGIMVPVTGTEAWLPGAGAVSGSDAPQLVQNFWTENSNDAPHFGQNLRVMSV